MTIPSPNLLLSRTSLLVVILWLIVPSRADSVEFDSLLKNPAAYQNRTVTIEGVIRGNGPLFELYRDASSARAVAPASLSFRIVAPNSWKATQPYNMRLVRVTGIVEANQHGIWGNACVLNLKRIEVLSEAPALSPTYPVAVVRNQTSKPYFIRAGPDGLEAELVIGPRQFLVLPRCDGTLSVLGQDKILIGRQELNTTRKAANFDSTKMVFYYRIAGGKVEAVNAAEAKKWGWRR